MLKERAAEQGSLYVLNLLPAVGSAEPLTYARPFGPAWNDSVLPLTFQALAPLGDHRELGQS